MDILQGYIDGYFDTTSAGGTAFYPWGRRKPGYIVRADREKSIRDVLRQDYTALIGIVVAAAAVTRYGFVLAAALALILGIAKHIWTRQQLLRLVDGLPITQFEGPTLTAPQRIRKMARRYTLTRLWTTTIVMGVLAVGWPAALLDLTDGKGILAGIVIAILFGSAAIIFGVMLVVRYRSK